MSFGSQKQLYTKNFEALLQKKKQKKSGTLNAPGMVCTKASSNFARISTQCL
jgi:hypothetical protein